MGTCEMCGTERVSTLLSEISGAKLRCCSRCIESNNLLVLERYMPKRTPTSAATQEPASRVNTRTPKPEREIAPDFHLRVRKSRESRGWEQRELAKRINVRLNDIQKIEGGIVPSDSLALKIEKALGIILLVEPEEDHERSVNVPSGRGLTIGDALDEFLSKGE